MKVQFSTGTVGTNAIEALAIPGFTVEDGLATITLTADVLDSNVQVGQIIAQLHADAADANPGDGQVFTALATMVEASWNTATAAVSEAQPEAMETVEAEVADTGSHSLPTGDETTSNASQDNSDATEEQKENGKQAKRSAPR